METLRCPACLCVLPDGGQKRCPSCRTRLGARGRPIVLGESSPISVQPVLPIDTRPIDAKPIDTRIVFVPEVVEAVVVEPEVEVEASVADTQIVFVPETVSSVVAEPHDVEPEPEPEPAPEPEPEPEPEAREIVVPEVVLHADVAAPAEKQRDAGSQLFSAAARKSRVKKVAKGRRGWVVDYVVPESKSDDAGT